MPCYISVKLDDRKTVVVKTKALANYAIDAVCLTKDDR